MTAEASYMTAGSVMTGTGENTGRMRNSFHAGHSTLQPSDLQQSLHIKGVSNQLK